MIPATEGLVTKILRILFISNFYKEVIPRKGGKGKKLWKLRLSDIDPGWNTKRKMELCSMCPIFGCFKPP